LKGQLTNVPPLFFAPEDSFNFSEERVKNVTAAAGAFY
jgi:hypothetical protein